MISAAFNFETLIKSAESFLWGWLLIGLIIVTGIILTIKSGFVQLRHLKLSFRLLFSKDKTGSGDVSAFSSLCTALSATIGTGNIIGVATAITAGGPGALLWMILAAAVSMATKYAEGLLAVKYREITPSGHILGGPFYYIEKGLSKKMGGNWKWLGKLFAAFTLVAGLFGMGTIAQSNGIGDAIDRVFDSPQLFVFCGKGITLASVVCGGVVTFLSAAAIFGGIKRIANISSFLVPIMSVLYVSFSLSIIIYNVQILPKAIAIIFKSAFCPSAAGGAFLGVAVKHTIQMGVGRGVFSNEAGLGSSAIADAAAKTNSPVKQGLISMLGTFIDTIVICTLTGLCIVITNTHSLAASQNIDGFNVTALAWKNGVPLFSNFAVKVLSLSLILFAFASIIGWNYYSEKCLEYLLDKPSDKVINAFRVIYILAVAIGPFLTVGTAWSISGIFNALMALPNLTALLLLSGVVEKETKEYFSARVEKRY